MSMSCVQVKPGTQYQKIGDQNNYQRQKETKDKLIKNKRNNKDKRLYMSKQVKEKVKTNFRLKWE